MAGIGACALRARKAAAWLLAAACLGLAACAADPSEEALRARIALMHGALEARDARGLLAPVAEDFVGEGGMDRRALGQLARLHFLRHPEVGAVLGPLQVEMHHERALVRFEAALGGGRGGFVPDAAGLYAVTTGWRFDDGEWMLVSAEWRPRW